MTDVLVLIFFSACLGGTFYRATKTNHWTDWIFIPPYALLCAIVSIDIVGRLK